MSVQTNKLPVKGGRTVPVVWAQPNEKASGPAKGIVLITLEFDYLRYPTLVNDLNQWAEEGYVGVALRVNNSMLARPEIAGVWDALELWLSEQGAKNQGKNWQNLPVYVSSVEGQSLNLDSLRKSSWDRRIKALVWSELNAEGSQQDMKNRASEWGAAWGRPTLAVVHANYEVKVSGGKDKGNPEQAAGEAREAEEKKLARRWEGLLNPPVLYLVPNQAKSMEARQYHAVSRAAQFFQELK
ncbi:MAG: hypothetical protein HC904_09450 [Blastochloris sp.]|nr:hypothetical protein [Blastochloris sp.]